MGAETLGQLINRRRRAIAGIASMFAGAACLVATIPGTAGAGSNPPGNNGTVKIDGVEFDTHPDNEPHVGCVFQVDFYGFDEGDLNAHVTFAVQPPTGQFVTILEDDVFIGEDDNSGGGSEAGLDAERTYDLNGLLDEFEQHPNQGWHIKLTVNAEGSQGADTKHKVFWVTGCETPPTTTSSTTSTTEKPTTTTEEETTSTTEEETTSTTEEETTSTTEEETTSTTEEETTSTTEEETTSTTEEETTSTTEEETTSTTEEETTSTTEEETTSTTEEETTSTTEEETTSTTAEETTSTTEGTSTTAAPSTTTTTMVAAGGELPKTGGGSQPLLIAAGIIMLLGGGALLGSAKLSERRIA
jgi:LPXTG-motif cell wall-anchored protein